ncbi:MAG: Gfo/Idh/MocA family oxidoreductase [Planctomycetaceae bacterium]|jgi:predicted dehydrogenase|nr:Gfo/Idh/MocA family oxidoreductase [Planctomycetaceae bacterium]
MTNISRRRFFEDSFCAAMTAGAAAGITKTLAADELTQNVATKKEFGANDRLGVCIVAAGGRAAVHAQFFGADKRIKILYCCDPDINRANALSKRIKDWYGYAPKAVTDFRSSLDDKAVNIVTCASSNHWHALTGILALQAGKHCYMEKPMTHNLTEGKSLVAAVKKYGLVFQHGTQQRSTSNVRDAVEFIRNGGIGNVNFARVLLYHDGRKAIGSLGDYPIPQGIDYDFWSGPAPVKPLTRKRFHYDWHWQRLYGNGDIANQGTHQIDTARRFLGVERFPNSVLCYGGRIGYDIEMKDPNYHDAGDTANTQVALYNYGDKSLVIEVRNLPSPPFTLPVGDKIGTRIGSIIYGTEGYAVQGKLYSMQNNFWWCFTQTFVYDSKGNLIKTFKNTDANGKSVEDRDPTEVHIPNFINAVLANDPAKVTANARCGELSTALCHLGNISYYLGESNKISNNNLKQVLESVKSLDDNETTLARTLEHLNANGVDLNKTPLSLGTMLKIDVDKEIFIDNNEANAMMTRDYRTPFVVPKPEDV